MRFSRKSVLVLMVALAAAVGSSALAVATLDLSSVATQATEDITATGTAYLPVLAAGVGLLLAVGWTRRLFTR